MSTDAFAHRFRSLPCVVLCVVLASACESAPVPTSPAPTLESTEYRVSGIVTDAAGAGPIADATVMLRHSQGALTTRTGADGAYAFSFQTNQPYQQGYQIVPGDVLGLLIAGDGAYAGNTRRYWTTVQLLPWRTPDVAQNVRLRSVRTLAAGESMDLSVEPDSSSAWDQEWDPWIFPGLNRLREQFFVSVQTDGLLTVDARTEAGGHVATLRCNWCPGEGVQGTGSIPVEARRSPYYFSIEVPRARAPQRYKIQTSLR